MIAVLNQHAQLLVLTFGKCLVDRANHKIAVAIGKGKKRNFNTSGCHPGDNSRAASANHNLSNLQVQHRCEQPC